MNRKGPRGPDNRKELLRYAGLSTEVFASVGLSVYAGVKADKWLHVPFPIVSWLLPLLVIVGLIILLVKETTKRKNDE